MKLVDLFSALLVPALALGGVVPGAVHGSELEEGLADLALGALNRRTSNHGCNANVRTVVPPNSHYIRYHLGQR